MKRTEELGVVAPDSLARAQAEAAAAEAGNGGNLLRAIEHGAPSDLKALRAERATLVARLLDVNHRIALTETHAMISPKDDGGRG